jgi:hypothetical protein
MRFRDFVIYAVDVGSVKQGNFVWASSVRAGDCKMETLIALDQRGLRGIACSRARLREPSLDSYCR